MADFSDEGGFGSELGCDGSGLCEELEHDHMEEDERYSTSGCYRPSTLVGGEENRFFSQSDVVKEYWLRGRFVIDCPDQWTTCERWIHDKQDVV